jgi:hypothetical protein
MPLPVGLTTIIVTGDFTDASGAAQAGTVSFTPTSAVTDAAGKAILTQTAVTAVLSAGAFSVTLPCTDNAGLTPLNWAYSMVVAVGGAAQTVTPVYLPHALGATVDISALSPGPIVSPPSGVYYLPNAAPPPTSGPSLGGGFLYASGGALYWLGPSGSPVLIAAP